MRSVPWVEPLHVSEMGPTCQEQSHTFFVSTSSLRAHWIVIVSLFMAVLRARIIIYLSHLREADRYFLMSASGIHIFLMFCDADLWFSYALRNGHVSFYALRDGPLFLMLHEADPCMTCCSSHSYLYFERADSFSQGV